MLIGEVVLKLVVLILELGFGGLMNLYLFYLLLYVDVIIFSISEI